MKKKQTAIKDLIDSKYIPPYDIKENNDEEKYLDDKVAQELRHEKDKHYQFIQNESQNIKMRKEFAESIILVCNQFHDCRGSFNSC